MLIEYLFQFYIPQCSAALENQGAFFLPNNKSRVQGMLIVSNPIYILEYSLISGIKDYCSYYLGL